jgi:hypothetical protein
MVHAGEGLIKQQHGGISGKPDGNAESAKMAVRQVARELAADALQSEEGQDFVGRLSKTVLIATRFRRAEEEAKKRGPRTQLMRHDDVVPDTHVAEDRCLLEGSDDTLAGGHMRRNALSSGAFPTIEDMAQAEGCSPSLISSRIKLAFLAPDIVEAILEGRQPASLTLARIKRACPLPMCWEEQRDLLLC